MSQNEGVRYLELNFHLCSQVSSEDAFGEIKSAFIALNPIQENSITSSCPFQYLKPTRTLYKFKVFSTNIATYEGNQRCKMSFSKHLIREKTLVCYNSK